MNSVLSHAKRLLGIGGFGGFLLLLLSHLSWLNDAAQTVQFALTATGNGKVATVWNDLFIQHANAWVTTFGFAILVWVVVRPEPVVIPKNGGGKNRIGAAIDDAASLEIMWLPGENNYYMYYGPSDIALQYRICVMNRSKAYKAVNVQVTLESIDPPVLECAPCCLRLKNDVRQDGDPRPYLENFDLKPEEPRFIDLLAQNPSDADLWLLHTVRHYTPFIKKQPYTLIISTTADNNAKADRKKFEIFKNGLYWQMRMVPLS
jgi:hypothetical protein